MSRTWVIGDILMDDQTPDDMGVVWAATVTGWDTPDTVEIWDQRPNDHGAFESPAFFQPRELECKIWAYHPDPDTVQRARQRFLRRFEINNRVDVVSIETVPWTASGRPSGRIYISHGLPSQMDINMLIKCKDPRKYGTSQLIRLDPAPPPPGVSFPLIFPLFLGSPPNSAIIDNTGSTATPGVFVFHGPIPGAFGVINNDTGRKIIFDYDLALGNILTVDTRVGSALENGVTSRRGLMTLDSSMFRFDPGQTDLLFSTAVPSAGFVEVSFAPASMG